MAATPAERVDTLRHRIQDNPDVDEADAEALLEFDDRLQLLGSEYSDHRREKLLRHCTLLAERVGGLATALEDRDAAETLVRHINQVYDNPETNRDYRTALRVFGKRVAGDDGDPPPSLAWIPTSTPSTYDPAPDPAAMLEKAADVDPMIEAASSSKQAAAIALQFDAGLRGGEFKDLELGQFTDHRFGKQVTVEGKQGQRTVTLIPSVPYLQKWLEDHPGEEGDPLWCKKTDASRRVSGRTIYNWFDRTADAADVDKPVTLTNFRKSSASYMASRGMNQAHLEERYGWVRGSRVASRYVAVFAEETELETARVYGKELQAEEEPDPMAPVACPRCGKDTPREKTMCVWCGQALEPGAAEVAEELESMFVDRMAESDDPDERAAYREAYGELRDNPERREEMVDSLMDQFS